MSWIVLIVSGVLEAVWATALGKSEGFSKLGPTAVFGVALVASMVGLAYAMRDLPVGTAYAVWVGIGASLTVIWAMVTGTERASLPRILLLLLLGFAVRRTAAVAGAAPAAPAPGDDLVVGVVHHRGLEVDGRGSDLVGVGGDAAGGLGLDDEGTAGKVDPRHVIVQRPRPHPLGQLLLGEPGLGAGADQRGGAGYVRAPPRRRRTRSSAVEHSLHTGGVTGSIPVGGI